MGHPGRVRSSVLGGWQGDAPSKGRVTEAGQATGKALQGKKVLGVQKALGVVKQMTA